MRDVMHPRRHQYTLGFLMEPIPGIALYQREDG
jgi:hypothetical protein